MTPRTQAAARDMEDQNLPDWKLAYSVDEAAAATSYGESTIRLKIAQGEIEARKDGEKVIILREDLVRHLRSLPKAPAPKLKAVG